MMHKKIVAFWRGMQEFRTDWTLHYYNAELARAYDWGREWAHRLTLRRWDR